MMNFRLFFLSKFYLFHLLSNTRSNVTAAILSDRYIENCAINFPKVYYTICGVYYIHFPRTIEKQDEQKNHTPSTITQHKYVPRTRNNTNCVPTFDVYCLRKKFFFRTVDVIYASLIFFSDSMNHFEKEIFLQRNRNQKQKLIFFL